MTEERPLLPKSARYPFLAEPFHCDFTNHLFLGHLGNHMLNAADYHSAERGYGMSFLNQHHLTWVLSRLAIEMKAMPEAYDKFFVETWVDSVMRYFTSRNYAVTAADGTVYGYGRSIWAMIDTRPRQPVDILSVGDGAISKYVDKERVCPIAVASRVKIDEGLRVASVQMKYADIDINGHVNSVKYIEHVLDLWPMDFYSSHRLHRLDIAYVAEAHCGDELDFYRVQESEHAFSVSVRRRTGEESHGEVCRCRVEFTV